MSRTAKVLISAVVMVVLSALLAGSVAAKPSGDGPGNKPNAKLCHKGGWENLVDEDGNGFASEEECVAYAAQGGVPQPKPEGEADLTLSPGTPTGGPNPNTYTYDWDANDAAKTFTVENVGDATSETLAGYIWNGNGGSQFTPSADPADDGCSGQALDPGETCTFIVPFNDQGDCVTEESYSILGNATPYIYLAIRPPSCPTAANLTLSPGTPTGGPNPNTYTYDWDANDSTKTFTVENVGDATSETLAGYIWLGNGQFTPSADPADDGCSGQALDPGETCTFVVPFTDQGDCVTEESYSILGNATPYIYLAIRPPSCPV